MPEKLVEKLRQGLVLTLDTKKGSEIGKRLVESDIFFYCLLDVAEHALDLGGRAKSQVNRVPREVINQGQIHQVLQNTDHFEVGHDLYLPLGVIEYLARRYV